MRKEVDVFDHLRKRRAQRQYQRQLDMEAIWQEVQRIHSIQAASQGVPAYDPTRHRLR